MLRRALPRLILAHTFCTGASVVYKGKQGCLPLEVVGCKLQVSAAPAATAQGRVVKVGAAGGRAARRHGHIKSVFVGASDGGGSMRGGRQSDGEECE